MKRHTISTLSTLAGLLLLTTVACHREAPVVSELGKPQYEIKDAPTTYPTPSTTSTSGPVSRSSTTLTPSMPGGISEALRSPAHDTPPLIHPVRRT